MLRSLINLLTQYAELPKNIAALEKRMAEQAALAKANLMLQRDMIMESCPRYADPRSLARLRGRVYSQNDEDAVISEIFRRIGSSNRFFVEIGIEDGRQNTTRLLLEQGWSGVWIEGNVQYAASASESFNKYVKTGQLRVIQSFVTSENVESLLTNASVPTRFDHLSIDIDQNTPHVWRALKSFRPRAVCIEYNATYPAPLSFEIPYNASSVWNGSSYFGASLKTLELIGREAGYRLVGCDFAGVNAYFVSDAERYDCFLEPFTAEQHYEPPRYFVAHLHDAHAAAMPRDVGG